MSDRLKAFIEHGTYLKACETHPSGTEIEHIAAYEHIKALEAFRDEVMGLAKDWGAESVEPAKTDEGYCINGAYRVCVHGIQSAHAKHFPKEQTKRP
jgi:hypothetical protein